MKKYVLLLACILALSACGSESGSDNASADAPAANSGESSANAESGASGDEANAGNGEESGEFENDDEKRSYALGMDIGNSLEELPVELNVDALAQGVRDTIGEGETRLSQEELDVVMQSFVQDMESAQKEEAQEQAQSNQDKGQEFLEENKSKEGVKTTDSGLQYKVVKKGGGPSPGPNDSVTVHYVGKLIDGTVFDSSRERGEPVTFPVDAVIPGWTEALQLMKQGAEYQLFIPADLAYGQRGAGAQIGPNETLIFDVELLKVGDQAGEDTASAGSQGSDQSSTDQSSSGASDGTDQSGSDSGSASSQGGDASSNGNSGSASGQSGDAMSSDSDSESSSANASSTGQGGDAMGGSQSNSNAASGQNGGTMNSEENSQAKPATDDGSS